MNANSPRWMPLLAAVVTAGLALQVACSRGADGDKDDERPGTRAAAAQPAQVTVEHGTTIVTIDPSAEQKLAVAVQPLAPAANLRQARANAVVLPPDPLLEQRAALVDAGARAAKAHSDLEIARKEQDRLAALYRDDQNASLKALEAAQGAVRAAEAESGAAEQTLRMQRSIAAARWGGTIAGWIGTGSPAFDRLAARQDWLVQVSFPAGAAAAVPPDIELQPASGGAIPARLVSPAPRVDPRVQTPAFLYLAPARPTLAPGLNVVALVPSGGEQHGVVVPDSAVVWSGGRAWVYVQTAPRVFARVEIAMGAPVTGGLFTAGPPRPGDRVVTRGAEALLSIEARPTGGGAEEGEGD